MRVSVLTILSYEAVFAGGCCGVGELLSPCVCDG